MRDDNVLTRTVSLPSNTSHIMWLGIAFYADIEENDACYLNDVTLTGLPMEPCVLASGFGDEYDGQWQYGGQWNGAPYFQRDEYYLYLFNHSSKPDYHISTDRNERYGPF